MENNLLLLKPWTTPNIQKLAHTRVLSGHVVHPDYLWRCVSDWLQRGAWRNLGGGDTMEEEPMGTATHTLSQSTEGTACTPASSVLNLTPVSSFSFNGMSTDTVWGSGAKLKVWSINLPG